MVSLMRILSALLTIFTCQYRLTTTVSCVILWRRAWLIISQSLSR